jgi:pimeloyl-ACP methyl ester carboxylesterase
MSQELADQMIAENQHATLVVIPDAGHFIPIDAPAAFEAAVRKWLAT